MTDLANLAIIAIITLTALHYIKRYKRKLGDRAELGKKLKELGIDVPDDYFENITTGKYEDEELRESALFTVFQASQRMGITTTELWRILLKRAKVEGDVLFLGAEEPSDHIIGNYLVRYGKYTSNVNEGLDEFEAFGMTKEGTKEEGNQPVFQLKPNRE